MAWARLLQGNRRGPAAVEGLGEPGGAIGSQQAHHEGARTELLQGLRRRRGHAEQALHRGPGQIVGGMELGAGLGILGIPETGGSTGPLLQMNLSAAAAQAANGFGGGGHPGLTRSTFPGNQQSHQGRGPPNLSSS